MCAQGVIGNYGSRIGRADIKLHELLADVAAAAKAAEGEDEAAKKELKDTTDKLEEFKKNTERLEEAKKSATTSGNAAKIKEATKALDEFDPLAHDYSDRVMGHDGGSEDQHCDICTKKRGENSKHWIRTLPGMCERPAHLSTHGYIHVASMLTTEVAGCIDAICISITIAVLCRWLTDFTSGRPCRSDSHHTTNGS